MNMTTAQLQAFKAAIAANTNTVLFGGASTPINQLPQTDQAAFYVRDWYNQLASGPFYLFDSAVPNKAITNQLLFANYTPNETITSANAAQWTACSMSCQGKQFNLELMGLIGSQTGSFDATLVNLRKGLKDATSALPSGTSFANQDGGWNATLGASAASPLVRSATNFEALFAVASTGPLTGSGSLGTFTSANTANVAIPATDSLGGYLEGSITDQDVVNAWNS